eukprot:TRINITY_DN2662_c0_g1_i2.p1 TRINITY_DN2662_c0_g1~~TRINITY_DN2662_c0_g1_i2.p1  ORF type:complete len:260 (+),score=65.19 TRINITY_DN2662_c0_g1_i2:52-780(+)
MKLLCDKCVQSHDHHKAEDHVELTDETIHKVKAQLSKSLETLDTKSKSTKAFITKAEESRKQIKISADEVREGIKRQMEELKAVIEAKTKELLDAVDKSQQTKEQNAEKEIKFAKERKEKIQSTMDAVKALTDDQDTDVDQFLVKVDNCGPSLNLASAFKVPLYKQDMFSMRPMALQMITHSIGNLKYRGSRTDFDFAFGMDNTGTMGEAPEGEEPEYDEGMEDEDEGSESEGWWPPAPFFL